MIKNFLNNFFFIIYIILVFIFYIYNTHYPLTLIPIAGHDDGLFVRLGEKITSGKWLGNYDHMILIKGLGLPILLAFLNIFKIPLTLFYSVFIILICEYMRRILKVICNDIYAIIVVLLIMWYPGQDVTRVLREPLLTWLLILSLVVFLDISIEKSKIVINRKIYFLGFILGFICIVREEWPTFVPFIVFLVIINIYFFFNKTKNVRYKTYDKNIIFLLFLFIIFIPTIFISTINFIKYGKFIAVDFKESNFVKAITSLQSIKSTHGTYQITNGVKPVPKDVRYKLYEYSPSFFELKKWLDDPTDNNPNLGAPLSGWQNPSCAWRPETCGDYGGNWSIWAIRDAVALAGYAKSPKNMSEYYGRLNTEISQLCILRKLECEKKIIPVMPNIRKEQIFNIYKNFLLGLEKVSLILKPSLYNYPSMGSEDQLKKTAKFLNLANYYQKSEATNFSDNSKILIKKINLIFNIKKYIIKFFSFICPVFFLIGLLSYFFIIIFCYREYFWKLFLTILWCLVFTRIILLSWMTETTFADVNHQYLAFVGPVLILSSFISIYFFVKKTF
jgi:hypothetical protein